MFLDAWAERLCFLLGRGYVRLRTAEIDSSSQLRPILFFEVGARNRRYFFAPIRFPRNADGDSVGGTALQQCHGSGGSRVLRGYGSLQDNDCIHVLRHGIRCDRQKSAPMEEASYQHRENADQPQLPVRLLAWFLVLRDVDKRVSQCAPPGQRSNGRRAMKTPNSPAACIAVTGKSEINGASAHNSLRGASAIPPQIVSVRCRTQVRRQPKITCCRVWG